MFRYFLDQQPHVTIKQRKLIQKIYIKRRKYNPFHLQCSFTKKKLCYCKKNPLSRMSDKQKVHLWTKDYLTADVFYDKETKQLLKESSQSIYKGEDEEQKVKAEKEVLEESGWTFMRCLDKIRCLGREQCINFLRSIKQSQRTVNILSEPQPPI